MSPIVQQNRRSSFSSVLSLSAMKKLERHDDELASICRQQAPCPDATTSSATESSAFSTSSAPPASFDRVSSAGTVATTAVTVCSVDRNDIRRVGHVGSGTYCKVDTVVSSNFAKRNSPCSQRFAYKTIDPCRIECPGDFSTATTELANEAKILSRLDHKNIIKLRGVSSERFSESFASGDDGYFLMMDILSETLKDRLESWKKEKKETRRREGALKRTQRSIANAFLKKTKQADDKSNIRESKELHGRIHQTVLGIAEGMNYLHSKNIVLRDMKPANIGYENNHYDDEMHGVESTVKLFDFGMAQDVDECNPDEIAGSLRYMAPEVMAREGYTLAVDVYSFGVVLYEICSLKSPFEESYRKHRKCKKISFPDDFCAAVVEDGLAPYADLEMDVCCPVLRTLIKSCCYRDPALRPAFGEILDRLRGLGSASTTTTNAGERGSSLDNLLARDGTGRHSISIEFDCHFNSVSHSTDRSRDD